MRDIVKMFGGILFLTLLSSCSTDDTSNGINQGPQLMVEAYVYANEPVTHVKVARIHENGDSDLIPINDANIKIAQGGVSASLELRTEGEGVYHISDSEIVFYGPEPLFLEITYDGRTYTATTTFPPAIESLTITKNHINITEAINDNEVLTNISWTGEAADQTYCIFSRGVETDSTFVYPTQTSADSPLFTLHLENSVDLSADHFTHIGSYWLYVSAVNDEFIKMYTQNSAPDLRGGPTNIEGAWGVFTAFNGLSVDIYVE